MEFVEAPAFTRHLSDYLTDDGYRELQNRLAAQPDSGDVIPGTGGFRKLRWRDSRRQKGGRGGLKAAIEGELRARRKSRLGKSQKRS